MRISKFLLIVILLPILGFAEEKEFNPIQKAPEPPASEKIGVTDISPVEDLMREHGVLERLLLIYEEIINRLSANKGITVAPLKQAAEVIHDFIENYHEKNEEQYIFPKFEKAGKLSDLVRTLRWQHHQGRVLTAYILAHANDEELKDDAKRKKMKEVLNEYIVMYRPHAAREDTILFPEFKKLVSEKEYDDIADQFEDLEIEKFGENGFSKVLDKVAQIEKSLGIYDLSQFTPKVQNGI
jgi:hemerythrin-like domain-containing protein